MGAAPEPVEIFRRAADEGKRRLDQSMLELVSTSFIAGFTIVFGIVSLAITHAIAEPHLGEMARLLGALAFAPGLVFLVIGRTELFTENFFDPVATAFERREDRIAGRIVRLWSVTFILNLLGGGLLAFLVSIRGVLPHGTDAALGRIALEIADRGTLELFISAIFGGALVALLSFLLQAVDDAVGRMLAAFMVGFIVALGPFVHVTVTVLHVIMGMLAGASVEIPNLLRVTAIATVGNLVGGLGLVTLSHVAQAKGAEEHEE